MGHVPEEMQCPECTGSDHFFPFCGLKTRGPLAVAWCCSQRHLGLEVGAGCRHLSWHHDERCLPDPNLFARRPCARRHVRPGLRRVAALLVHLGLKSPKAAAFGFEAASTRDAGYPRCFPPQTIRWLRSAYAGEDSMVKFGDLLPSSSRQDKDRNYEVRVAPFRPRKWRLIVLSSTPPVDREVLSSIF